MRYLAETLSPEEVKRWDAHRFVRLLEGEGGERNVDALFAETDTKA